MNAHMEITTQIGCNLNCKYCPQGLLANAYTDATKRMTLESYMKYLNKIPTTTNIHFSGFCEPFLNPECLDMVEYTCRKEYNVSIFTTLVGLGKDGYDRIHQYEYDLFCLHVPDEQNNSKFNITQEYLDLLAHVLANKPKAKRFWISCHGTLHPQLQEHIKQPIDSYIIDRAGNINLGAHRNITGYLYCTATNNKIDQNVLLPNGDVTLCCMDYGLKHILGNLNDMRYEQLHESDSAHEVYKMFLGGSKGLCNKCNRAKEVKL